MGLLFLIYSVLVILQPDSVLTNKNFINDSLIFKKDSLCSYAYKNKSKLKISFDNILNVIDTTNKILDSVKVGLWQYIENFKDDEFEIRVFTNDIKKSKYKKKGTKNLNLLLFNISQDINSWNDLINLDIEIKVKKEEEEVDSMWNIDYIYIEVYYSELSGYIDLPPQKINNKDINKLINKELMFDVSGRRVSKLYMGRVYFLYRSGVVKKVIVIK